jgi:hypothetical protein
MGKSIRPASEQAPAAASKENVGRAPNREKEKVD